MVYEQKNFENLLGIVGFSDQLLKNHFTLYRGYVDNTNKLIESITSLDKEGKTGTPEFAELKRRFGWEFNGMRLHEYYFGNMAKGGKPLDKNSNFYKELTRQFGSYEAWEKYFKASAMMRGIGWVTLYYDKIGKMFFSAWINEHDVGHISGGTPLLVLDVFEHAYMIDYGLKRADCIEAFFKVIDWQAVVKRFE